MEDIVSCRSISPAKGSLLKSGSIYLATKEHIESSISKSRIFESAEKSHERSHLQIKSSVPMLKFTKGVTETAIEKLDKSSVTDRSIIRLVDESIVRSHLSSLADGKSSHHQTMNATMYDRHRLVRSKLEQVYTNSLIHVRRIRQENQNSNKISLK